MTAPGNSWRYKMTVEVETPQGVQSGSAVRQVTYEPAGFGFLAETRPHWRVKGQAVIVDLPNGKSLYALLRSAGPLDVSYGARIADFTLGDGSRVRGWPGPLELYPTSPKIAGPRGTSPLPMLVTFADSQDSKSVELVDPHNLAAALGQGYVLKRITIDIVSRPITAGIEQELPWLGHSPEPSLKPGHSLEDRSLPAMLKHGDFFQGYK